MKDRIEQLEKELAELKTACVAKQADRETKFKVGDWVIINAGGNEQLNKIAAIDTRKYFSLTIKDLDGTIGAWEDHGGNIRLATPEEIENGFREGWEERCKKAGWNDPDVAEIEAHADNGKWHGLGLNNGNFKVMFSEIVDSYYNKNGVVYHKGKWAELKPVPKIKVNGYEAEFCDGYVKFGCAKIDNRFFTDLARHKPWEFTGKDRGNRTLTAIQIGEGLFDVDTINKINERLKNG